MFYWCVCCRRLLGNMSAAIVEQTAWKYSRACSELEYMNQGGKSGKGHEYEKAVRYLSSPRALLSVLLLLLLLLLCLFSLYVRSVSVLLK
jgi:hypothetical protein